MRAPCEPRLAAPAAAAAGTRETREPAGAAGAARAAVAAARRCATALVAVAAEGVARRGDDAGGEGVSVVFGAPLALASSKRFASSVRARASACTSSSLTRLAMLESQRSSTLRKCASDDSASVLRDTSRLGGAGDEVHDEPGASEPLGS